MAPLTTFKVIRPCHRLPGHRVPSFSSRQHCDEIHQSNCISNSLKILDLLSCFPSVYKNRIDKKFLEMRFSSLYRQAHPQPPPQPTPVTPAQPATPINNQSTSQSSTATPTTSTTGKVKRRKGTGLSTTGYTIFSAEQNKIVCI